MAHWHRYYGAVEAASVDRDRLRRFEQLTKPTTLAWSDGLAIRLLPREQLSRVIYVSGTYEPNTLCVLRALLGPGDVFLDVGAHAGVVSLAASRWVGAEGMVYSFEPSEREFRRLLESVNLSAAANVTPVHLAAAATSGRGLLRVARSIHSGLNTLGGQFAYDAVDAARLESVETIALDDFVDRNRIGKVAAIKLDIEGAEAAALAGAMSLLRDKRPVLIVEIVSSALRANGSTRLDVEALLRSADYRLHLIDDVSAALRPVGGLDDVDEQNVVALPEERSDTLMSRVEAHTRRASRSRLQGRPATRSLVGKARRG